jgi:WD40 repeat protein
MAEGVTSYVRAVVWSPCSKFIAVSRTLKRETVLEILDAVTLKQLTVLYQDLTRSFIFSPDSRLLTWFSQCEGEFLSWDLRAGVRHSTISPELAQARRCSSLTYSECGRMLAVLFSSAEDSTISIYNVLSGAHTHSHQVGHILGEIWTHGESIRYASFASGYITIWEFEFASGHQPTQVKSLPTPGHFCPSRSLIHPTLSRLAFINQGAVLVQDCQESRFLLDCKDLKAPVWMSFSHDGCLFACGTHGGEIYLWKETPTGYVLHRKFQSGYKSPMNCVSPDGRLIVGWGDSGVQVWRTTDPATSLSSISTKPHTHTRIHKVEFSPGEVFVAITQLQDNVVTVLHLESGEPWLVINTGLRVSGLRVGSSAIVVVGRGTIVTWDLPAGNYPLNVRVNIDDSVRTVTFSPPGLLNGTPEPLPTSISSDLHRMAIVCSLVSAHSKFTLSLYDVSTGQCLASVFMEWERMPWLVLGEHDVWCGVDHMVAHEWSIIGDGESIELEPIGLTSTKCVPGGLPCEPSCGYRVTDDGWVLSSKYLLWLPPYSRSDRMDRVWIGQFLALLCPALPEPVLLELPVE